MRGPTFSERMRRNQSKRWSSERLRAFAGFAIGYLWPIFGSEPLRRRPMLALCLNHTSAASTAKTRAASASPIASMTSGATAVAESAAADE